MFLLSGCAGSLPTLFAWLFYLPLVHFQSVHFLLVQIELVHFRIVASLLLTVRFRAT
jgi:hypothetical protein